MAKHKCARPDCQNQIDLKLYACGHHWRELPPEAKVRLGKPGLLDPSRKREWVEGHRRAQEFWKLKLSKGGTQCVQS
jgi:hypothetical protein